MKTMTAKELKNKTGDSIRTVANGEKVIITLHGKPFALISPVARDSLESLKLRPMETAWSDIENILKRSKPKFKSLKESMDWTRKRNH